MKAIEIRVTIITLNKVWFNTLPTMAENIFPYLYPTVFPKYWKMLVI